MHINTTCVNNLNRMLNFTEQLDYPADSMSKPLVSWKMEEDDAPIFRYIYRNFRPRRHLEFGTWQGSGVLYCLEECDATVWTINILDGEESTDGKWAYSSQCNGSEIPPAWSNTQQFGPDNIWYQTDSLGFIGRYYLEAGYGHRVCQIYCDSRKWDTSNYPDGFFDSALIDGGHTAEIVMSDTVKALKLVRPGGLIMWHDFCPDQQVQASCASAISVTGAIMSNLDDISSQMRDIFWIKPSWILLGIRK
jgi:hypothetical protein